MGNKGGDDSDNGHKKGGLKGGFVLEGSHGYRRRRGQNFDACYVIDKNHHQCLDDDNWNYPECKVKSQEEYENNQACYDCQDDDCIQSLCAENEEVCHPGKTNCTCCACAPPVDDETRLLASSDKEVDECPAVLNGECANADYKSCCPCFLKMQKNLKCDEEPPETGIFSTVVLCIGGAIFVLYLLWWAWSIAKEKCSNRGQQLMDSQ